MCNPIPGREKFFGVIYRGKLEVHPRQRKKSSFCRAEERWSGEFNSFSVHIEGDDQKKVINFMRKNVHPRENPGYACAFEYTHRRNNE